MSQESKTEAAPTPSTPRQIDIITDAREPTMITETDLQKAISDEMAKEGFEVKWIGEDDHEGGWAHANLDASGRTLGAIVSEFVKQAKLCPPGKLKQFEAAIHLCDCGPVSMCDHPGVPCKIEIAVKQMGNMVQQTQRCVERHTEKPVKPEFVVYLGAVYTPEERKERLERLERDKAAAADKEKTTETTAAAATAWAKTLISEFNKVISELQHMTDLNSDSIAELVEEMRVMDGKLDALHADAKKKARQQRKPAAAPKKAKTKKRQAKARDEEPAAKRKKKDASA